MPQLGARGRRDSHQGGGTSAAPAPRTVPWAALIAVAVLAAGGIAYALSRDGKTSAAPAATGPDEAAGPERATTDAIVPPPPPTLPERRNPAAAAARLERALATERLYGKTSVRGDTVEVRSSFCAQSRLVELVGAAATDLRAEGLATLTCVEPHGAQVFTRSL